MSKLRKQFEALPEIKLRLIGMVFCFSKNQYTPKNKIIKEVVVAAKEVNLAWYAFQEQQKKIDDIEEEYAETERHLRDRIENLEVCIKEKDCIIESDKMLIQKLKGF